MCDSDTIKQIQKSHMAVAKTISDLGADTNKRLNALERKERQTHKILREIQEFLHTLAERL